MNSPGGPVLGRYGNESQPSDQPCEVRLIGMPTALFVRAREHHDELLREFALMAIGDTGGPRDGSVRPRPPRLAELVELLGRRYSASASRADAERDAAIERGDPTVDLVYHVPPDLRPNLQMLRQLMADADEFCREEQLLTLPRDPAIAAFSTWYVDEFIHQIDGAAPTPWNGPLE